MASRAPAGRRREIESATLAPTITVSRSQRVHCRCRFAHHGALPRDALPVNSTRRRGMTTTRPKDLYAITIHLQPAKTDSTNVAEGYRRLGVGLFRKATGYVSCTRHQHPKTFERHFFFVFLREDAELESYSRH